MSPKPGIQTTEFWTTLLTFIGALFTMIFHKSLPVDVPQFAVGAAAVSSSFYSMSRAIVKKG